MAGSEQTGATWASDERLRTTLGSIGDHAVQPRPFDELDPAEVDPWSMKSTPMRHRRVVVVGLIAASVLVGGMLAVRSGDRSPPHGNPLPSAGPVSTTVASTLAIQTTVAAATTIQAATTTVPPGPLSVMPYGMISLDPSLQALELDIQPRAPMRGDGAVVLSYNLQLSGSADSGATAGRIIVPPKTEDGQLALAADCPEATDCTAITGVNGSIALVLPLIVRRTSVPLSEGTHDGRFQLEFDNGTSVDFTVVLLANPLPSAKFSDEVQASTGRPTLVQTVPGVGRFGYHVVSAFGSIWVLGKYSGTVARIDAVTGAITAMIDVGGPGAGGLNRLAASDDALYVSGSRIQRIDPIDNTVSVVPGLEGPNLAVIAVGRTLWTGGFDHVVHRVDPDGSVTQLDVPGEPWIDLAMSNGLIWALSQARGHGRLIAFDGFSGELRFDLPVAHDVNGFAVRLVADERSVVVGVDSSSGAGRLGELWIIDPLTGAVITTVPLSARPEGIVLADRHIWTSAAVVDRDTLAVTEVGLGFSIARGPDGSIWGTSGGTAVFRYAPGDFAG